MFYLSEWGSVISFIPDLLEEDVVWVVVHYDWVQTGRRFGEACCHYLQGRKLSRAEKFRYVVRRKGRKFYGLVHPIIAGKVVEQRKAYAYSHNLVVWLPCGSCSSTDYYYRSPAGCWVSSGAGVACRHVHTLRFLFGRIRGNHLPLQCQ
jgi:hypothetical protein